MTRKIAVLTTFSEQGWQEYAERMVTSWITHWPHEVDLYIYPDEKVAIPSRVNTHVVYDEIKLKTKFIRRYARMPQYNGRLTPEKYNYRFDAIKFCHKPFALWHWMQNHRSDYDGLIWLDADTITHTKLDMTVVNRMAPAEFDAQFLGRQTKYTECGYLYFNLNTEMGRGLLEVWISFYLSGEFRYQKEWHDSWLFDCARGLLPELNGSDLTSHLPRRKGGGHPFVNSFMGAYMDHHKGALRKVTGKPRKNDLFLDHTNNDYWRKHGYAKASPYKRR